MVWPGDLGSRGRIQEPYMDVCPRETIPVYQGHDPLLKEQEAVIKTPRWLLRQA